MARVSLIIAGVASLFGASVFAVSFPPSSGFVNDFANLFSADFKNNLEQSLRDFEKQTGAEISVATFASLEENPIEDVAVKLFEEWKIGKKGQDNGVLLLIAPVEREAKIEVGYGLEPLITDSRAGNIISKGIVPAFKQGLYEEGVQNAIASLEQYIVAQKQETPQERIRGSAGAFLGVQSLNTLFIFLALPFIYLLNFLSRSKSYWLGGLFGSLFGAGLGWLFESLLMGGALIAGMGAFGLFLDKMLSHNYQERKKNGQPTDFFSSRGGFFGGGLGGGRGFGGFGGGSSGGGGASGRW